ncbi:hypothetical protein [Lacticaseibacillus paracasei]|uniref:hypothetical protein n=1 Tax=Lacticaseibacillus paracasei TaxID=1597 RepID=UPI0008DDFCE2|nr:hypothetical protein [Lacticaseibacillus paracasei]OHY56122.1 hypothetical protein BBX46_02195 [Lacticaseibacillus paracasei]
MNYYNDLGTNQAAVYTFGPADVLQTVTNFVGSRIFGVGKYFHSKSTRPFLIKKRMELIVESKLRILNLSTEIL